MDDKNKKVLASRALGDGVSSVSDNFVYNMNDTTNPEGGLVDSSNGKVTPTGAGPSCDLAAATGGQPPVAANQEQIGAGKCAIPSAGSGFHFLPPGKQPVDYCFLDVFYVIKQAIIYLQYITGLLALTFLLVGAVKYASSFGDPKIADSGRKTITYAIAGLILVIASYAIVNFIWLTLSGQPFEMPGLYI